jgi:hypothetical protein
MPSGRTESLLLFLLFASAGRYEEERPCRRDSDLKINVTPLDVLLLRPAVLTHCSAMHLQSLFHRCTRESRRPSFLSIIYGQTRRLPLDAMK